MHNCTTCVFYSPPGPALNHDGVEKNPKYDYNVDLSSHMCLHKARKSEGLITTCEYMTDQARCPLYESNKNERVLEKVQTEDGTIIELIHHLTKFNFVTYSVVQHNEDEEIVLYSLDEHQTDQARTLASDYFDQLVEEHNATSLEIEEVDSDENSYLKRVMIS